MSYTLAPQAEDDLFEIWYHIAQDNLAAADRVDAELHKAFNELSRRPGLGHKRSDLTWRPVRFYKVHSYLIVYREKEPLEIVAVFHAARDISTLLDQR